MINSLTTGRSGKLPTGCKLNYNIANVDLIIVYLDVMPQCYVGYTICVGACVHVCLRESPIICICVLHTNDIVRRPYVLQYFLIGVLLSYSPKPCTSVCVVH